MVLQVKRHESNFVYGSYKLIIIKLLDEASESCRVFCHIPKPM